jgi:hypothetical protein
VSGRRGLGDFGLPRTIRVHRDEKDVPLALPSYGFRPRVEITDDEDDRSVLPPGRRFADTPNLGKYWSG